MTRSVQTALAAPTARGLEPRDRSHGLEELWGAFVRSHSQEHRNRLIEIYLPLVRAVAARIAKRLPPHVDTDDLVSAGVFGLVSAIENYDRRRNVKFETYCRKRVSGAMLDELRRQDWIPREARERADLMRSTASALRDSLGRDPDDQEIAEALGQPLSVVHDTLADIAFANRLPLDPQLAEDKGDDGQRARLEPVDGLPEPPEQVFHQELIGMVDRHLSRRERTIVQSYYRDEQTMKWIGSRMRLSESRVCQMHMRLLHRLKERLYQEVAP